MAKAIQTYTGGINGLIEAAIREDGVLFKRYQDKTRYGYRWTGWKEKGNCDVNNIPKTIEAGFATLYKADPIYDKSLINCRLPNPRK